MSSSMWNSAEFEKDLVTSAKGIVEQQCTELSRITGRKVMGVLRSYDGRYKSGNYGNESYAVGEAYLNAIGRAGRLGVSMSKKGCSYLLATDRRGMADYWKRYVTAGNMEINSAFSRLDILKQAPFMLNSFVGKKGESISEHDAATFF